MRLRTGLPFPHSRGGGILNPIHIALPAAPAGAHAGAPPTGSRSVAGDASIFGRLFGRAQAAHVVPADATPSGLVDALVTSVKTQLDRGATADEIAARLAASLATSVAHALGITVSDAHTHLAAAFHAALVDIDTGPPKGGSAAQRAAALVARLRQTAAAATRVVTEATGQPIRSIAEHTLDAEPAKARSTPTPESGDLLRDALAALATPPARSAPSTDPRIPAADAGAADRRIVAIAGERAVATGGDALLGRILTRALAANDAAAGRAADGPRSEDVPMHATAIAQAGTAGTQASADAKIAAAFVDAFAAALAQDDGGKRSDAAPAVASVVPPQPANADAGGALAPTPPAIGPAVGPAAVSPPSVPSPQPSDAQRPVDANAIVEQVLRGITVRSSDGSSQISLRLVPEHLGDVSVRLTVAGGTVDASITAHSADAQNALAGAQTQLAKTLADAGLKLQSFSVGLGGGGASDAREGSQGHDRSRRGARRVGAVDGADGSDGDFEDDALLAAPSFGPPIYTPSARLGALSYLA